MDGIDGLAEPSCRDMEGGREATRTLRKRVQVALLIADYHCVGPGKLTK
jgi:hypothetical protein